MKILVAEDDAMTRLALTKNIENGVMKLLGWKTDGRPMTS